jgi:hypothetical protein
VKSPVDGSSVSGIPRCSSNLYCGGCMRIKIDTSKQQQIIKDAAELQLKEVLSIALNNLARRELGLEEKVIDLSKLSNVVEALGIKITADKKEKI